MRVLIITYYWPPAGGSGVQRWLKFVKYLKNFDIIPVVYTVKNPNYAISDTSLENEVPKNIEILKQDISEPNSFLSKFKNKSQQISAGFLNASPTFIERQLRYIRANYFIPDARKFWVKPSVKFLSKYLKNNKIDAIITTGPPHSMHLIGMELQKEFSVKWIADFRDPWTDIDYFHQLPLTKKSIRKHQKLEQQVVQEADEVIVVGKTMEENYKKFNTNIEVITNGFDGEIAEDEKALDKSFSITHVGLMNADRNPKILWEALSEMIHENLEFAKDLELKLIGKVADEVVQSIQNYKLVNHVQIIDYVPHKEVMNHQKATQVLLLSVNNVPAAKGIITGKIFEYLQVKRPILAIAPLDGDLAEIINKTNAGIVVDFEDKEKLKKTILDFYNKYKVDNLIISSKNIAHYHRKNLTKQLAAVIKNIR